MRSVYAQLLFNDPSASLDDRGEAVTMLEETERTARRVLGVAHPTARDIERTFQSARAALRASDW